MAEIGAVIDGKYEIVHLIAEGGMSRVYLAMDQHLNKQWAVKEIKRHTATKANERIIQSLVAEANLMKKLDHPALPRVVDIINSRETIYVIMDYIEGENLSSLLMREGVQPQDHVIDWAKQLCEVLDYLHTQSPPIIYRDMKPSNVILKSDGRIKLLDFGIACEYTSGGDNAIQGVHGYTKGYAPPEQIDKKQRADRRSDIFSLGATMHRLLTGLKPDGDSYEFVPIRSVNPVLSGGLENIIKKCVQINPEERYQTCPELLYDLENYPIVDDEVKRVQRGKLRKFILALGLSVGCLAAGIICQGIKYVVNNNNYDAIVQRAESEVDSNARAGYYVEALSLKPTSQEAYEGLIDTYKSDAEFTLDEEKQLKQCLNENMVQLQNSDSYAQIAFDIGKLYWYYYGYGTDSSSDNQVTRMKGSIKWFQDAADHGGDTFQDKEIANIYCEIGKFNRDINLNVEEAEDKGLYAPYWKNLENLISTINADEPEIVQLEVLKLTADSIENYAKKFKADEITEKEMQKLWNEVVRQTGSMETTTDKTETLKESIIQRFDEGQAAIQNAYLVQNIEENGEE